MNTDLTSLYNNEIQEVVKANWTITSFDFISMSDFQEKFKDPQYSFLILNEVKFVKDKTNPFYDYLSVWLGKNIKDYKELPELCGVPLAYHSVDEDSYLYKLGTIVRFIQQHLQLIRSNPNLITKSNVFKYYNDNMGDIKTKTLYLVPEDIAKDINTLDKIKKIYPYDVKIVTHEEVKKAIEDKDDKVVFLHKIGPEGTRLIARCYKIVIGTNDGKFYYFNYHMIDAKNPDGFCAKDFKKIMKKKPTKKK